MTNNRWNSIRTPKVLSVLSGKGGVGKSVVAFNLADQLSARGYRVLLVDADFASGNLHILANSSARVGINEYLNGQLSLRDSSTRITNRLSLLAASWNDSLAEARSVNATAQLVNDLRTEATGEFDLIILDHASGRSNQAATLAHASDYNLLVVVPELTSLTDAYGLYKFLATLDRKLECGLVINRSQSEEEVEYIKAKLPELARRFLGIQPSFIGAIPEHEAVRRSIAAQAPLSAIATESAPAKGIEAISNTIADMLLGVTVQDLAEPQSDINKITATADTRG